MEKKDGKQQTQTFAELRETEVDKDTNQDEEEEWKTKKNIHAQS